MEITKEKLKNTGIILTAVGTASQYISASVINSFDYIKNYQFDKFWDSIDYNLFHPITNITNALSNEMFTSIQPFLIGGTLFIAGKYLFNKADKYEDASEYGAYGTARWARDSEIFSSDNITTNPKEEGTLLGLHKRKPIIQHSKSHLNRNICLVGGSGAGKTRSVIIPNILKNTEKSIVVIDPKGELYEKTSQVKREQGYEVHLINFKNRDISDRYNLFDYIRRDSDAFKIADTLVNNAAEGTKVKKDFWNQAQASVLQALILYVKHTLPPEQQHMGSVMNLGQANEEVIKGLFEAYPETHIVRRSYQTAVEKLKDKTLSDVFVTLMQTLNPWQYEDVCQFTAANDFLFEDLGTKKMIVYVIMPIADNEFRPLITTFFSQLFSELYRLADLNYGVLPNGVLLELDEFANIGKIPNFEERLSTTRSLGIEVTIVLQDTSQLENRYGKDLAKEILNNCDIKLLLKTTEYETAKYFSHLAGKTTIKVKNKSNSSGSKSSSKSESNNYISRDLITPDEVMRLKKNDELLFLSGQYPMKVNKAWFDKFKYFKNMLGKEVSRDDYPVANRGEYQVFYPVVTKEEPEFDEVLFIPNEPEEKQEEIPEETLVIEEMGPPPPEEPKEEKHDDLEDFMNNFKF
ncbi:VirD4-like conjugal transfer protein, CD1115 family [Peribacillus asahii]|uniref:VirD4-like conjugal transfer protein, CD1115 family n=1 Tax=Peribacillus asahii TaxID=228899 RepID=UPI00207A50CA|nr:type IV secretory system conjugative DNA transfer family protein [Peribacillus asahii]USK72631.1 type IV secretory system conjugative DNA transfer family protein [Peribacillus asahii]USK72747.1 type IV secretory system conjugative DNA transfer family protein [Peribacillus asahii]